jgi:protein SCO1/2
MDRTAFLSQILRIAVVAALTAGLITGGRGASPSEASERLHGFRPKAVALAPLFELTTHEGQVFSKAEVKGRPFAVFFGFTHCPDVCPTTLQEMSNHLEALGPDGDRLKVLFITVDPERDTAEHLKAYLASFDRRIIALTGDPVEIASVVHAFRAFSEKVAGAGGSYTFNHTAKLFLVDRYGLMAATMDLQDKEMEQRALLRRLLAQ